ncbi:MAG TPA: hypothetical protein VN739_00805 [Nitrososphaerales archaeon]|nr:hypothetical protein [Nitrososphaerales archaeon]
MSVNLRRNPTFTVFAVLSAALILVSGIMLNVASAGSGPTITAECTHGTSSANGCTGVVIDQAISENLGYAPHEPIYVHHNGWVTIRDTSLMPHTFTLVSPGFEPHTTTNILACDAPSPGTVCLNVLLAHVPGGVPPTTFPTPPYPNTCVVLTSPTAYQCVKGGVGLASGSLFPGMSTPFTSTTNGDSLILFGGQSISVQITAPAGTVLHFMCVIHPWMQGEIIVTS